jgi:energy-coupling factor transporter ATP-binding protein EcfA2
LGLTREIFPSEETLPEWKADIPTRYFESYEGLEAAFRQRINGLVPRYYAGTRVFWKDFQQLYDRLAPEAQDAREAYITSNPRDCLAFGTPYQVLQGAWLSATRGEDVSIDAPIAVAARFGLTDHLHQSIRSLSGGETVRLALAKAYLQVGRASRLTVASPFSWLSLDHWKDFRDLAEVYRAADTPLELFALEGEDILEPHARGRRSAPLMFSWRTHALRLDLGTIIDRLFDRSVWAEVAPWEETLESPCLLWGDNGQGKSLIAKVFAGALPFEGEAGLRGPDGASGARLLFQDVLNQTLMRSVRQLAPPAGNGHVAAAYDAIVKDVCQFSPAATARLTPFAERRRRTSPPSLIEMKILLTALRLANEKSVLILDEPDWGLSRSDAVAFVSAVIAAAHARGLPLILISHKPWWRHMVRTVRRVSKEPLNASPKEGYLFRIKVTEAPGGAI